MAKQIIIKGTPVVAANEVLVADSNSKIPAVDGSAVTAMAGGNIASGTIPTARLDSGTTANKLVVLGGSGLPAVDGSLLTGIVSHTTSASDPTISTNPSGGVGTEWINSTTGKQFICTDATAGENVWTCSGGGTGDILQKAFGGVGGGESYGWAGGGYPGPLNSIDRFSFTSDANATDAGDLTRTTNAFSPSASTTHGYVCGGADVPAAQALERFQFSTQGNSVDIGDCDLHRNTPNTTCANSSTYGYCAGGSPNSGGSQGKYIKFNFSASSTITQVGSLTGTRSGAAGSASYTYGYFPGGSDYQSNIDKFSFASDANTTDAGDLTVAVGYGTGASSNDYGYTAGGRTPTVVNVINKFSFSSDANATDTGNLLSTNQYQAGSSSATFGYISGGESNMNQIQKFSFSTDGNATDVADLTVSRGQVGGWFST